MDVAPHGHAQARTAGAAGLLGQLQGDGVEGDDVIPPDGALLLLAEDGVEVHAVQWHEGARGVGRDPRELVVVVGDKALGQVGIGGDERRDPREGELVDEAPLHRPVEALAAAPGLGGVGADVLDGSPHVWLRRCPDERQTLLTVVDDATTRLLYAQLWPGETTAAVFAALHAVCTAWGLPIALYTDRAHWAFHTPTAGGPIDRTHRTQVGRALEHLGIEHIGAYSPQARGRSERLNRTVQGRLVNELALAGITTRAGANAYLTERFIADYNDEFARPPADSTSAFVPLPGVDLDAILCEQEDRRVGQDNVVTLDTIALQIAKQPGRPSCAGVRVTVRRDVHGMISVWHGARCFGRYDGQGRPLALDQPKNARAHLPQDRRSITISSPGIPRLRANAKRRCRPRLPTGPRD